MNSIVVKRIRLAGACLFLGAALTTAGGCSAMLVGEGGSAGRPIGTSGASARPSAADQRIAETIRRRYAADAELSASKIQVSCVGGVVTLRGQVSDYSSRDRAVRLARDLDGVNRVSVQIGIAR